MIRVIVLSIILVVQVAVWLVVDPPWRELPEGTALLEEKGLDPLEVDAVARIAIRAPTGDELVLTRDEAGWVIESEKGFPAVEARVAQALEQVADLGSAEFRSDKGMMHETYEVDDERALRLAFFDQEGRELLELLVGKRDVQGAQGTFVRRAGEDDVFVARSQNLGSIFSVEPRAWYEAALMDVDPRDPARANELKRQAYRIEIDARVTGDDGQPAWRRFVYEQAEGQPGQRQGDWSVVEPQGSEELRLDDLLVKNLVGNVLAVRAERIVGPGTRPEYGLDRPDELPGRVVVSFRDDDGHESTRTIAFGEPIPQDEHGGRVPLRFARVSFPGDDRRQSFVFGVPAVLLDVLVRGPEVLSVRRTEPPPAGD